MLSKEEIFGLGALSGFTMMSFITAALINDATLRPESKQWARDGGKAELIKNPTAVAKSFISSSRNPLTESFIDKYTVTDFSANALTIKGIDDQAVEEATTLVKKSCEVQQIIDVDLPTGRERLVFVTDKNCLDQLGK